eukprot:scaffold16795_cov62-Phaeocystis_antarctica.AAC.5
MQAVISCGSMAKAPPLAGPQLKAPPLAGPVPLLAGPQLGSCASSGRAWWLGRACTPQGETPGHRARGHCFGCSS